MSGSFESTVAATATAGSADGRATAADHWASVPGVPQAREDRLPLERALRLWNQVYELFGANSEGSRDEAFLAVNMYFWSNGCSPSGKYGRDIRTGGGIVVPAASVVKIVGKLEGEIRQFLRGCMRKSYEAMKYSPAVQADAVMADKAETLGVPRSKAFLLADWLRGCEYMTPEESAIQAAVADVLIRRANDRRNQRVGSSRVDDRDEEIDVASRAAPASVPGATSWAY